MIFELPEGAVGIAIFAHGSGSGSDSPRNRMVAQALQKRGIGTLLIDLEPPEEESTVQAVAWARERSALPIGLIGSSTGAAVALRAAVLSSDVVAVVGRGGRPDLAADILPQVRAPTLLIVGGNDHEVLELNRTAYEQLQCEKQFEVVPGATHLFSEPGTLERAAELAADWLLKNFEEGR